jgi:hypothetical protein
MAEGVSQQGEEVMTTANGPIHDLQRSTDGRAHDLVLALGALLPFARAQMEESGPVMRDMLRNVILEAEAALAAADCQKASLGEIPK